MRSGTAGDYAGQQDRYVYVGDVAIGGVRYVVQLPWELSFLSCMALRVAAPPLPPPSHDLDVRLRPRAPPRSVPEGAVGDAIHPRAPPAAAVHDGCRGLRRCRGACRAPRGVLPGALHVLPDAPLAPRGPPMAPR
jgi:hypothetical protein